MTPLSIHIANLSSPARRRPVVTPILGFELVCLALTAAGVLGMFLGIVLKGAFG